MLYEKQHFGISEYFCKEMGTNFSFPTHMHHSFEFIVVTDGEMCVTIENKSYDLQKGEGVVIFPEQLHSLKSEKSEHILFIFSSDIVASYSSRRSSVFPTNSKISVSPLLISMLKELQNNSSIIKIKAALYLACSILDESAEYTKRKGEYSDLLRSIIDFVENNYDKDCTLSSLSTALGYNPSYLSRYFSEVTNISFNTYVNNYKINRGCYILKNTDKSILECAYECGYKSLRSFNRNFKATIGSTPKEYREKD